MTDQLVEYENAHRIAKVRLDVREIASLMDLPEGVRVLMVVTNHDPVAIEVMVTGDPLPLIPYDSVAPHINGHVVSYIEHEGHSLKQIQWRLPTDEDVQS